MALIWYVSDQPDLRSTFRQDFLLRKIAHLVEFGVLTWLVVAALRPYWSQRIVLVTAVGWALAYAVIDEWHQSWVVGRHGAASDVAIDLIGILLAALLLFAWQKNHRSN